jgi:peptidoglycan/xylan/chitin deacetylase (PgdA/CDA1 family)
LSAPILLYHATFSEVPKALKRRLHNVTPELLYRQLRWVRENFDAVLVDELFVEADSLAGKCAITFDDAYQCVLDEALPVLETLNLSSTVFINGVTLTGRPMWRDKIRYLLNLGLTESFVEENRLLCQEQQITAQAFYRSTKNASVNGVEIDRRLSDFLAARGVDVSDVMYGVANIGKLIAHPLISYGNHSFNHYVLSSLSDEQQEEEIRSNQELLLGCGRHVSKIFAAPFGGGTDINETTVRLCKRYGYAGILCSSRKAESAQEATRNERPYFRKRYMAPPDFGAFHSQMSQFLKRRLPG